MKLFCLSIVGFRRIKQAKILFGDATFLIGANNAGKSSVLKTVEYLLSDKKQLSDQDYYSEKDEETGETKVIESKIVLEAEFRNLPKDANTWRGFKGRIFNYKLPSGSDESGLCIFYRKTYELGKDVVIELKSQDRKLKEEFKNCNKPQDIIDAGIDEGIVSQFFTEYQKKINEKERIKLEAIDEMWDIESNETWFHNPGGIPGNVLSRLPTFLLIPADLSIFQIQDANKGVLGKTLNELFEDVRKTSQNYEEAQKHLNLLAKELDPTDKDSEFGKMMIELNSVLGSVFPESQLHAYADLSDPDKALKPSFEIKMSSNVQTNIENQGTGMVRSAVFGLLRYRQRWQRKREDTEHRSLIIGFEEPEIYLHPSAANQMRDAIYQLSDNKTQIISTTHSRFLIDISRKPRQVLNRFRFDKSHSEIVSFSVSDEYNKLQEKDKIYVKMLLKIDDYIARAFFTKKVVIIEGDTEDIVIREALTRLPDDQRLKIKANFEIIKARGKASIISLVKYLKALGVDVFVIHDRDASVQNAAQFNEPIRQAVGDDNNILMLEECIEDVLGYQAPSNEKPYRAYTETLNWGDSWDDVPLSLQNVLQTAFNPYI